MGLIASQDLMTLPGIHVQAKVLDAQPHSGIIIDKLPLPHSDIIIPDELLPLPYPTAQ